MAAATGAAADPGPEPSGRHGPHVFVDDLEGLMLADGDRHHLARVLRLRPGDALTAGDGAGRWRACRLAGGSEDPLEPVGEIRTVAPAEPAVTVAFAVVKGQRPEWTVQKLTELGVDRIVMFTSARSVVRWDEGRATANHRRLQEVARQAAMQSRRCWLAEVSAPTDFATATSLPGAALAERDAPGPTLEHPVVLTGPEGGWSTEERARGLPMVGLGAGVLRAETAAVAAGTLLTALRLGLVAPAAEGDRP